MTNIMDYHDTFPGQYTGDQQSYARGMDDYHRKLNMVALREFGKHYDDLDVHTQKVCENKVEFKGSRKGTTYQLAGNVSTDHRINDYVELLENKNEYKKHKNVSDLVITRLTK